MQDHPAAVPSFPPNSPRSRGLRTLLWVSLGCLLALPTLGARTATPAEQILLAWNAALDTRNAQALAPLYSAQVQFYGMTKTADQVLAAKRDALARNPQYRQRVDNVSIETTSTGAIVRFQKFHGAHFRNSIQARLTLVSEAGSLKISEETDAATDALLKRLKPQTCLDAALAAARRQPQIVRDHRRVAKKTPDVHPGDIIQIADDQQVNVSLGYFHAERFEARWQLSVENQRIHLYEFGTETALPFPPAAQAAIRNSCSPASP